MMILVLDDEDGARRLLVNAIHRSEPEAEIRDFTSPEEGLRYAEQHSIDIAFLDIRMPEISGIEVAKRLKKYNPFINIVFTTGYSEYAMEAINLRSSGYLMKPVSREDVSRELKHLRYPISNKEKTRGIYFHTFGNFDMYVDGSQIAFRRGYAKEMLAYLVDRKGSSVTRKELAAAIFEDNSYSRKTQSYITQIVKSLRETLAEVKAEAILITDYNSYAVDTTRFTCDAYQYLEGVPEAMNSFHGEYMTQYSWAEFSRDQFYE